MCVLESMCDEGLDSFKENEVWELVDNPQDSSVIQYKRVFEYKCDGSNNFHETFSLVVRYSTLRSLFALLAKLYLNISHLNITTAL